MLVIAPLLSCVAADGIQDLSLTDANQILSNLISDEYAEVQPPSLITDEYAEMQPLQDELNKLRGTELLDGCWASKISALGVTQDCKKFITVHGLCEQHRRAAYCCKKQGKDFCSKSAQKLAKKLRNHSLEELETVISEAAASEDQVPSLQETELFTLSPCYASKMGLGKNGCKAFLLDNRLCTKHPNALKCCENEFKTLNQWPVCSGFSGFCVTHKLALGFAGCDAFFQNDTLCKKHPKALGCCVDDFREQKRWPACTGCTYQKICPENRCNYTPGGFCTRKFKSRYGRLGRYGRHWLLQEN